MFQFASTPYTVPGPTGGQWVYVGAPNLPHPMQYASFNTFTPQLPIPYGAVPNPYSSSHLVQVPMPVPQMFQPPPSHSIMHNVPPQIPPVMGQAMQLPSTTGPTSVVHIPPVSGPAMQLLPATGPAMHVPPISGPAMQQSPTTGPAMHVPPVSGPVMQQPPNTGPAMQLLPSTGPAMHVPPVSGPVMQQPPNMGPAMQPLPSTGPAMHFPPVLDPAMQQLPNTGPAMHIPPVSNPAMQLTPNTGLAMQFPPPTARRTSTSISHSRGSGSDMHAAVPCRLLRLQPYPSPGASSAKLGAHANKKARSARGSKTPSRAGSNAYSLDSGPSHPDAPGVLTDNRIRGVATQTKHEYALACLINGPAAMKDNEPHRVLDELLNMGLVAAETSCTMVQFCLTFVKY